MVGSCHSVTEVVCSKKSVRVESFRFELCLLSIVIHDLGMSLPLLCVPFKCRSVHK